MHFTDDELRKYEYLMKGVPNFKPRGHGITVVCGFKYVPMYETRKQLIVWATQNIKHPEFRIRLNNYLLEKGEYVMDFVSKNHKETFEENIRRANRKNNTLLAAIYLLSANFRLQRAARVHIYNNQINFKKISTKYITEEGYTLLCAARDLYLNTKYISITDLCDEKLISPEMFGLICTAIGIKRFGLRALGMESEE